MLEEMHTMAYWLNHQEEFRGLKRPMYAESVAHRGIASYESDAYCIEMLDGPDHEAFEIDIRDARRRLPAEIRRVPGLRKGVDAEIIVARVMAAKARLWIPYILGD